MPEKSINFSRKKVLKMLLKKKISHGTKQQLQPDKSLIAKIQPHNDIALLVVYIKFRRKIHLPKKVSAAVEILTGFGAVCGVTMIYAFPVIMNIL